MNQEDVHLLNLKKDHELHVFQVIQSIHSSLMDDLEVVFYQISSHPYEQIDLQESR